MNFLLNESQRKKNFWTRGQIDIALSRSVRGHPSEMNPGSYGKGLASRFGPLVNFNIFKFHYFPR